LRKGEKRSSRGAREGGLRKGGGEVVGKQEIGY